MRRPNLLFLYTDEQRFDTLKAYGNHAIDMPNLDALAGQSCVFERAYITQPVCTPSRSSILTGLYPHTNGCATNNIPLDDDIPCLPEMLPRQYETGHFGKWHLGDELFPQHGFNHWVGIEDQYNKYFRPGRDKNKVSEYSQWLIEKGYNPENGRSFSRGEAARLPEQFSKPAFLAEQAGQFIRNQRGNPFCLFVNFLEPHMPFTGPRDNQYDPSEILLPENFEHPPTKNNHLKHRLFHKYYTGGKKFGTRSGDPASMRRLIARYLGLCSQVDAHCGAILDTLRDCGLWDDTIVVFTSDHGDMMGSHQIIAKCVMYEEAVRVPLLVKPAGAGGGSRIQSPVSQVDLAPTLLEMMGEEAPGHLQGRSLAGAIGARTEPEPRDMLIEWNGHNNGLAGESPDNIDFPADLLRMAPRGQIVESITDPLRTIISGNGRWKLNFSPALGQHELYDLQTDPYERRNLFGDPAMRTKAAALAGRLRKRQADTGDHIECSGLQSI